MARQSGLLKRMKAASVAKTAADTWRNLMTACQMVTDAALLAAHDVLQLDPGRAAKFMEAIGKYANEIAALLSRTQRQTQTTSTPARRWTPA